MDKIDKINKKIQCRRQLSNQKKAHDSVPITELNQT